MMRRLNLRAVNKNVWIAWYWEVLLIRLRISIGLNIFEPDDKNDTFIESLLRYGANFQAQRDSNQLSLFGDSMTNYIETPKPSNVPEWNLIDKLEKEKEVTASTSVAIRWTITIWNSKTSSIVLWIKSMMS